LTGALDVTLIGSLRATLDEALLTSDEVLVNAAGLRTIDSTGIRELLRAQARAATMGKSFGVVASPSNVRQLLEAAHAAGLLVDREGNPPTEVSPLSAGH
jgi:anti-anti-sigma regulatory factor